MVFLAMRLSSGEQAVCISPLDSELLDVSPTLACGRSMFVVSPI